MVVIDPRYKSIPMKWSGLCGTMNDGRYEASARLITENGKPEWFCLFNKLSGDTFLREFFEAGELEQAYNWCYNQISDSE
jgi:hypothetical protein